MATLKDLWDWPNNSANGYMADSADWSGDESYGMDYRIAGLLNDDFDTHDRTQVNWNTATALHPVDDIGMTVTSTNLLFAMFKNYWAQYSDTQNLSFYMLRHYPAVIGQTRSTAAPITKWEVDTFGGSLPRIRITIDSNYADQFSDSTYLFFQGTDYSSINNNAFPIYADKITSTTYDLYTDSGLTTRSEILDIHFDQDDYHFVTFTQSGHNAIFIPEDFPHIDPYETYVNGSKVRRSTDTTLAGDPDTDFPSSTVFDNTDTDYHIEALGDNRFALYTDVSRTTAATLTEKYLANTQTGLVGPSGVRDFGTTGVGISGTALQTAIQSRRSVITSDANFGDTVQTDDKVGFARIKLTPTAGATYTFTASDGSALPARATSADFETFDTDYLMFYFYDDSSSTLYLVADIDNDDNWTYGPRLTETSGTPGESVSWEIKIVDHPMAYTNSGLWFSYLVNNSPAGSSIVGDYTNHYDGGSIGWRHELDTLEIKLPGTKTWSYKDASNATVYDADLKLDSAWFGGGTALSTTDWVTAPTGDISVNGSGKLTGTTLTTRGLFNWDTTKKMLFEVRNFNDLYVAPTPYAEDVWDTDDEWDDDGYASGLKRWPTIVSPNGIKFTVSQPSSVTISQSGRKYVRSSGVIRHQMEVSYPPMTYDEFREYEATAQAARGQATPFYFQLRGNGSNRNLIATLFGTRTDAEKDGGLANPYNVKIVQRVNTDEKLVYFEGFDANRSNVFIKGEMLIINNINADNGYLTTVVNDNVDSNKYGEAVIRIPYAPATIQYPGVNAYKNPFWVNVTLADDNFEYSIGTDGLYRVNVRFDFDRFK